MPTDIAAIVIVMISRGMFKALIMLRMTPTEQTGTIKTARLVKIDLNKIKRVIKTTPSTNARDLI